MDMTPSVKPRKAEPVSPMNIFDGLKLNGRKPSVEPASAAVMTAVYTAMAGSRSTLSIEIINSVLTGHARER